METDNPLSNVKARGSVDYLLRTTQQNHMQLSTMADQKASILMGVQAVLLTMLFKEINDGSAPLWGWILAITTFASVIFSLMAVKPAYRATSAGRPNWLFFSSYAKLSFDEYKAKMAEILQSDPAVYETILNDVYQLGKVLYMKKYRFLAWSYRIFLGGFAAAFGVVVVQRVAAFF
jgi:hypothetical protein